MKKIIGIFLPLSLLLCALFSGCGLLLPSPEETTAHTWISIPSVWGSLTAPPETTTETTVTSPPETTTQTTTTAPPPSLLSDITPAGSLGNSFYVPCAALEKHNSPRISLFGEDLLAHSVIFDGERYFTLISVISLYDGGELASLRLDSDFCMVRTGDGEIGVCMPFEGKVMIYDGELNLRREFDLPPSNGSWYLSPDLTLVYSVDWDTGLTLCDLQMGTSEELIPGAKNLYVATELPDQLSLSYIDPETLRYTGVNIDLATGLFRSIPVSGDVISATCHDGTWLIGSGQGWGNYYYVTPEEKCTAYWSENALKLLTHSGRLATWDNAMRELDLYDPYGSYISTCRLPQNDEAYVGMDLLWSEFWNGYFLTDNTPQGARLVFWDISAPLEHEDLELVPYTEDDPIGTAAERALYERAHEMSLRYGIEIMISDKCALDYVDFTASRQDDPIEITKALDTLESAFSAYPDGFLAQLSYGSIECIRVEIVTELLPKDTGLYSESYSAFAHEGTDRYLVVMETETVYEGTVYHEFAHIIDRKLEWNSYYTENALFSEEAWLSHQPEGFEFAYTYGETSVDIYDPAYDAWFVKPYSRRYPTEDRATLMEEAMIQNSYIFAEKPGLAEKLAFYSACIRDCFNTEGWPPTAKWETVLTQSN